jgi:hypothetical protein
MKLRGIAILVLAFSSRCLFGTVVSGPVVDTGTINYQTNQVTLNGSGFELSRVAPKVVFSNTTLSVVSAATPRSSQSCRWVSLQGRSVSD